MSIDRRPEIDKLQDEDLRQTLDGIFSDAFGAPIDFDAELSADPTLDDMEENTWGFRNNKLFVKWKDGTGTYFSGTAMS